jgi:hypothetical protein
VPGIKPHVPGTGPSTDAIEPPDDTGLAEESPDGEQDGQDVSTDAVTTDSLGATVDPEVGGDSDVAPAS